MINVARIKAQFPILNTPRNGKPLIYVDSAATTQKPTAVIEAMRRFYEETNANVHRAVYSLGADATEAYENARAKAQMFIGAESPASIVFTRNASEAINLVAQSWGSEFLAEGDEILLTQMEHHSNIVPWQLVARRTGAILKYIPITKNFTLDMTAARGMLTRRTKMLGLVHVSNVLGTVNPVAELIDLAHSHGAVVLLDAAQSVPHIGLNVRQLDCDFAAFSGHKMLGPTGIGVLYGKADLLNMMPPYMGGGEMISEVYPDYSTYRELPWKFEAGTPNIAGAVGLGAAIDYLAQFEMSEVAEHERQLHDLAIEEISGINGVNVFSPKRDYSGIVSFALEGVHPHDVATFLDGENICVRAGTHCAQPLLRVLGEPATTRASFYIYNTPDDVRALSTGIRRCAEAFHRVAL